MKPFITSLSSSSSCDHSLLPYNSKNRRHGGCMGRILRRILWFNSTGSPPREEDEKWPPRACGSASTPGIVARLMGFEPLPFKESIVRSPVLKSFAPFRKPRSPDGRYHRIIPSYQQVLEDENFFILSFENMDFPRRSRSGSGKKKQGAGEKCKKKGTRRRSSQERGEENDGLSDKGMNDSTNPDPNSNTTHERERKKKVKRDDNWAAIKPETEGNSQNSSPNSVLDFIEAAPSPSSEGISRLKNSKLRRTLSEELDNCTNLKERTLFINKCYGGHIRPRSKVCAEKRFETRELAEHEMIRSSWDCDGMSKNHHDHFQEIGKDITSQVLDQLLLELINNLSLNLHL